MPPLPPLFADLQRRVADLMATAPTAEFEKHLREALSSALSRMDLVTREEFDQQQQQLARARQKLADLEARLAALESADPAARG